MSERKSISVNGILLSYLSLPGSGKGTVLLLHGWRSEAALWEGVMQSLSEKGFAAYALDLPGFGKSGNPPVAFSVQDYADTVAAFMEKTGIQSANLIGHSFGGRIGIVLASRNPKVTKLVLVDAAGIRNPSFRRSLIGFLAKLIRPVFLLPGMGKVRKRIYSAFGAGDYLETPALQETFKKVIAEDLRSYMPHISQETLLLWGENDMDTPLSYAKAMVKEIPHATLSVLPEAGHFSFLDAPQAFTRELLAFL